MTMSATLQVVGNVIQGQPVTCIVTVSNSSGASVNVTSVQPKIRPINSPFITTAVVASPQQSLANAGASQFNVAVPAAGSTVFAFQAVALGPMVATGQQQQGSTPATVTTDITSSDGSVISPVPQWLAPANPQFGQPPGSPPNASFAFGGSLQFNQGKNSSLGL